MGLTHVGNWPSPSPAMLAALTQSAPIGSGINMPTKSRALVDALAPDPSLPQDASAMPPPMAGPPPAPVGGSSPLASALMSTSAGGSPVNTKLADALIQSANRGGPMTSMFDAGGRLAQFGVGSMLENRALKQSQDSAASAASALASGDPHAMAMLAASPDPQIRSMALQQIAQQSSPTYQLDLQTKQMGLKAAQQAYALRQSMMNDPEFNGGASPGPSGAPQGGAMPRGGGMPPPNVAPTGGPPGAPPGGGPSPSGPAPTPQQVQQLQQQAHADIAATSQPSDQPLVNISDLQKRADFYTRWAPMIGGDEGKTMLDAANSINGRINNMVTSGVAPGANGGVVPVPGLALRPVTDPAERARYNIPATDQRTAFISPKGELTFPGQPTTSIVNQSESAQSAKMGETYAGMQKSILDASQSANDNLSNIQYAKQLLDITPTGFGADELATAQSIGRSLGIPESVIGSAGPAEALRAISNQLALNLRNPSLGAGMPGSLSNSDRDFLSAGVAGLDKVPGGNALIMDLSEKKAQRALQIEQMREDYANQHGGNIDSGFVAQINAFNRDNPIFGPDDVKRVLAAKSGAPPSAASPAPSASKVPAAGAIENGYRFKDGDPSKQENWEPAQ